MFSVNINKLVAMTDVEKDSYTSIVDAFLADSSSAKSFSIVGGGVNSFKVAYTLMKKGKKVLFVDGDISTDIFLGKYKLGKNMKGLIDYIERPDTTTDFLCLTNEGDLKIVFTGNLSPVSSINNNADVIKKLFEQFKDEFDYFVVDSDQEGTFAKYCDSTVIMLDENDYSETTAEVKTQDLEDKGCNVLGVVVSE